MTSRAARGTGSDVTSRGDICRSPASQAAVAMATEYLSTDARRLAGDETEAAVVCLGSYFLEKFWSDHHGCVAGTLVVGCLQCCVARGRELKCGYPGLAGAQILVWAVPWRW